jgi:hypothetical protein
MALFTLSIPQIDSTVGTSLALASDDNRIGVFTSHMQLPVVSGVQGAKQKTLQNI